MTPARARISANLLSAARIALLPFLLLCVADGRWFAAAGLLVLAGATDVLDGRLARHATHGHGAGAILDAAADVLIALSVAFMLYRQGLFNLLMLVFTVLAPLSYGLVCLANRAVVRTRIGRYAGAVCMVCYGAIFLTRELPPVTGDPVLGVVTWALGGYLCVVSLGNVGHVANTRRARRRTAKNRGAATRFYF